MQLRSLFKLLSPILATIGGAMLLCILVAFFYQENPAPLLIGGLSALAFSGVVYLFNRKQRVGYMAIKDGCILATLAWVFACIFGALPLFTMKWFFVGTDLTWTKSLYEAISGFTTTGASILSDIESLPKSILFWRSFMHWFGGMGIVVFAIAVIPKIGIGGMQALRMESPGPIKSDKLVPRISETARILYTVYLAITLAEVVALMFADVSLYDALTHTFGTVGTGGFSPYNNSIAGLNNVAAEYIIAFFMWLSGVNFALTYVLLWKRDWRSFLKDIEFRTYSLITILAILIIVLCLLVNNYENWSVSEAFRYAVFQVPTILTTTGYATYDYGQWPIFAITTLCVLMFIGGSTGSTGGGPKVLRHIISFKAIKQELKKIARPNLVESIRIGDRIIDKSIVNSVLVFSLIYLLTFAIGAYILSFFGLDIISAVTASIANLGNIGPGLNIVGPTGNYADFHPVALWVLMFQMLAGRLEIYTVFVAVLAFVKRK